MKYNEYRDCCELVNTLTEARTHIMWEASQSEARGDLFSEAQFTSIRRALSKAIALIVSELTFEEFTSSEIKEEDYLFYNSYHPAFDDVPATFWEYLARKEAAQGGTR